MLIISKPSKRRLSVIQGNHISVTDGINGKEKMVIMELEIMHDYDKETYSLI